MTIQEIIDGLQFTVDMFSFDPLTGETLTEPRNGDDKITIDACKGAIELLKQKPKTGKWVQTEVEDCTGSKGKIFCCSECNRYPRIGYWGEQDLGNFCPNCGADMRGEK